MFTINHEVWIVKFMQPYDEIFRMDNGEFTIGVCDDNTKTIYISNLLRGEKLKQVLCHEIVHAAMFSYNVELEYEQEELLANLIAIYGKEIVQITDNIFKRLSRR
jgi:hypothetical protein